MGDSDRTSGSTAVLITLLGTIGVLGAAWMNNGGLLGCQDPEPLEPLVSLSPSDSSTAVATSNSDTVSAGGPGQISELSLRTLFWKSENFYEPAVDDIGYQIDSETYTDTHLITIPSNSAGSSDYADQREWGSRLFRLEGRYKHLAVVVKDPGTKSLINDRVQYRVRGDSRELDVGYPTVEGVTVSVNVEGVYLLRLESSTGGYDADSAAAGRNQNYADEVWWMNPVVTK